MSGLLDSAVRFRRDPRAFAPAGEPRGLWRETVGRTSARRSIVTEDWEILCVEGADIVVEASRLNEPAPMLKTDWIKRGAFVVPYGTMSAVELSLTDIMSKLVVDDWGQCKGGPFGSIAGACRGRQAVRSDACTPRWAKFVAGLKSGREREDETILFWHRGLSLSDIALGHCHAGEGEAASGLGQRLRYA
jgi:alanine dehydrogenase